MLKHNHKIQGINDNIMIFRMLVSKNAMARTIPKMLFMIIELLEIASFSSLFSE